jgi:hypothetical protein
MTIPGMASVGVFSGDWEYDAEAETYTTGFTALRFGPAWNGFATPVVSHGVMRAFVARQHELRDRNPDEFALVKWSADGSHVVIFGEGDDADTSLYPDRDGGYDLGWLGWCFEAIEDRSVRHVIADNSPLPTS